GDRDGVRTPMQWSPDRNAGFSHADPARLVLPPIMDPIYGYGALNVEAQSSDAHSLLNWTRRMLALRGRHTAFGRGTIRFLKPANRKILAYLREHGDETILCVVNLSRLPQAVELDLAEFQGRFPVEMTGMSAFPPIGQLTYLLTLQPYGFFWFQLMAEAEGPAWRTPPPAQMDDFVTIVLKRNLMELMEDGRNATVLSRDVLPAYLGHRRWFGAKGEPMRSASLVAATPMPFADGVLLSELEVEFDGHTERYFLPLAFAWDDMHSPALAQQLALARVRQGRRVGLLTDGFAMESMARAMMRALAERSTISGKGGTLDFHGSERLDGIAIHDELPIVWLSAEQSNSSLVIGDLAMVKLIRHVFEGIHPEVEMTRYLTDIGYTHSAPLLGEITRTDADGHSYTLVIVQGAIRNQGDAWNWMLDGLRRTTDELLVADGERHADSDNPFRPLGDFAAVVGRRLGELHAALAAPTDDEAFKPLTVDQATADEWRQSVLDQLATALDIIAEARAGLDADVGAIADRLLARRERIVPAIARLSDTAVGTLMTRIHGDFHLGQVLVSESDAYIIDFEGEPTRGLEERRAKTSPLRDVAGFLRSLSYAAASADTDKQVVVESSGDTRQAMIDQFSAEAEVRFLEDYFAAAATSPQLALSPEQRSCILDLFLIGKAAYEIAYEAGNRPKWLPIPLRGLSMIVDRLLENDL
ncbi:MAG: putative maltokinase, partial [Rhizobium sp.]